MVKKILVSAVLSATLLFNLSAKAKPDVLPETKNIMKSINSFDSRLFSQLSRTDKNVNYSAISIYNLLYALLKGSDGETQKQLCEALDSTDSPLLDEELKAIISNIKNMTNSVWYKKSLMLEPVYKNKIKDFNFMLKPTDFTRTENTRNTINSFIAKNTKNLIPKFLDQDLDPLTQLVLLNTLYFQQKWEKEFDKDDTVEDDFYTDKSTIIPVDLMFQSTKVAYYEDSDFQAIELPYKDNRYSMIVFLPKKRIFDFTKINLPEMVEKFCTYDNCKYEKVEISLPKFDLNSRYDLVPILQSIGINDIFSPTNANIPKIFINNKRIFVDTAIHEVRIIVNEKETKAAAVTMFGLKAMGALPMDRIIFRADHPFCYVIRDKDLNINLFSGIVRNPLK
ncbi:MAG: serpin family protein [Treponema sp.]|nr:serpin family protein [Treponema sp.]